MALKTSASGKIDNHPYDNDRRSIPKEQFGDATKAIHKLDLSDISGGLKSNVVKQGTVRIDRQNPPSGGGSNLQVQVNGLKGNSTIATVVLTAESMLVADSPEGTKKTQTNVLKKTITKAFIASLESGNVMKISGSQD